jgi:hypothetical protein
VPWTDLAILLPWLGDEPYLVGSEKHGVLTERLSDKGFLISEVEVGNNFSERKYAGAVLASLGVWGGGGINWDLFNDRIRDFYSLGGSQVAIVVRGIDSWFVSDFKGALRCVYKSLEIVNGLYPDENSSQRQISIFFVGDWPE